MKKMLTLCCLAMVFHLQAQEKTINKTFSNVETIQLSTGSGNITIKKSQGAGVNVSITHSYDGDEFTPVFEENNGKLIMKEKFSEGNHSGNSAWTIAVPDNVSLNLNSGSGDVTIAGVSTDVKSNLGSGNVSISAVKGELTFNTGSGDINLNDTQGELAFNTGSGDIRAEGGTGNFRLNAGSGDIDLTGLSGTFDCNTGSGDLDSKNVTIEGPAKFNSGSGDAIVALSGQLNHSIDVASGSGDARLRFNGTAIEGQVIMTANKHNGKIVAPFDFDSEETIENNNSSARIRKTARLGSKDIQIKVSTGSGTAEISK